MSNAAAIAIAAATVDKRARRFSLRGAAITVLAGTLTSYFVIAAWSLYWLTAGAGAVL